MFLSHLELKPNQAKTWCIIITKDYTKVYDVKSKRYNSVFNGYSARLGKILNHTHGRLKLKINHTEEKVFNKTNTTQIIYLKRKPTLSQLSYIIQHYKKVLETDNINVRM